MASKLKVIGLGYVGLPVAFEACRAGLTVTGFDISSDVVEGLNAGQSHIDDVTNDDVSTMQDCGFVATGDPADLADGDVFVICVPTPLSDDGAPDLSAVVETSKLVGSVIGPGCLVVLESTTYPGTTAGTVRPLLELGSGLIAGIDFSRSICMKSSLDNRARTVSLTVYRLAIRGAPSRSAISPKQSPSSRCART